MAYSKIDICNSALAMLGADLLRSFDENNKRARMCFVFFDMTRDYLLSKFDWPFARAFRKLQLLDVTSMTVPEGWYPFKLPSDCRNPRELHPPGSKDPWRIMGSVLYCKRTGIGGDDAYLYYTIQNVDPSSYSDTFASLLSLGLAVRLCPSITQDKALTKALRDQFREEQRDAWESDANIGNEYREFDEDPNNDAFVNPDGSWGVSE